MNKSKKKRKRIISTPNKLFDKSFESAAAIQKKRFLKIKPKSRCMNENFYVHAPVVGRDGQIVYNNGVIKTFEREYNVKNCFLQGLDKETTAGAVASIREWLNRNLKSNLPIYLINGHSSFNPRIKLEMQYDDDEDKRVTRRQKIAREKKESEIREYQFTEQLKDGMSIMRDDESNLGPNFFTTPQGVFIIETTPVSLDAACGTGTMKRFFRANIADNFSQFRESFMSSKFNDLFYSGADSDSVRLIIPPMMSAFNKVYTFDDVKGSKTVERYGILKFSQDMSQEELESRIDDLQRLNLMIEGTDDVILQKKKSALYQNTEMKKSIIRSITDGTSLSLQQIINKLGPGVYFDFSCSGLVYRIYEKNSNGEITRTYFEPDFLNTLEREDGVTNMIFYNILMENFEELQRQYHLHMNNIVQRDGDIGEYVSKLPESSDTHNFLTTDSSRYAIENRMLTDRRYGLQEPELMNIDEGDVPDAQHSLSRAHTDTTPVAAAAPANTYNSQEPSIYFGGKKKKRKTRRFLPKLRKLSKKNVKHRYKLKYSTRKRRMAINEGVTVESKKRGMTMKKAAISKKRRFNLLRMYRKNKNPKACRKITKDMRYIDKKYKLGKTKNICKKTAKKKKNMGKIKTMRR